MAMVPLPSGSRSRVSPGSPVSPTSSGSPSSPQRRPRMQTMVVRAPQWASLQPLFEACHDGRARDVEALLDLEGDIDAALLNERDAHGRTPLMLTCIADGYVAGAPKHEGRIDKSNERRRNCAELLLERGARPDVTGPGGWTALFFAVFYDLPEVAQVLVAHGASANVKDHAGRTVGVWARYGVLDPKRLRKMMKLLDNAGQERPIEARIKRGEVNECVFHTPMKLGIAAEKVLREAREAHGGIESIPG